MQKFDRKKQRQVSLAISLVVFVVLLVLGLRNNGKSLSPATSLKNKKQTAINFDSLENKVLVSADDGVEKVNLDDGKTEQASAFEKEDLSGFEGLPKFGDDGTKDTQQGTVLISKNKNKAIVRVFDYASSNPQASEADGAQAILAVNDFVCDASQKKCEKTEILSGAYQGLDSSLQKPGSGIWWDKWDSENGLLCGFLLGTESDNVSPVYVCDTAAKNCKKTEGFDSLKNGDAKVNIPAGTFSPSLSKFAMVNQHDKPNVETGKNWDFLIYDSTDLTAPLKKIDISAIIDVVDGVAYDSVRAVTWSGDEEKIAIGTTRRIFLLDVESGSLSLAYVAPVNDDGDAYWDFSSLFMSPDGKSLAFVDEADANDSNADDPNTDQSTINALKKIDLENSNKVSILLSAAGLSLK